MSFISYIIMTSIINRLILIVSTVQLMFSAVFLFALEQCFLSCLSYLMMKCHFIPLNGFLILACKEYIKLNFLFGGLSMHVCMHAVL